MKSRHENKSVVIDPLESRVLFAAAKQVMGFLPDYEIGNGNSIFSENGSRTTDTLNWSGLSQVDYFSVLPTVGTLPNSSTLYSDGTIQSQTDSHYQYSSQIPPLVHDASLHNVPVFLAVGGGDPAAITDMNALLSNNTTDAQRANLAVHLSQLCSTYGLTGVDLDWEPANTSSAQVTNFGNLIADIRGQGLNVSADGLPQYNDIGNSDTGNGFIFPFSSTALANLTSINVEEYTDGSFTYPATNQAIAGWATAVGSTYVSKIQYGVGPYNTQAATTVNSAVTTTLSQGYGGLFVWTLADPNTAPEVSEISTDLTNAGSSVASNSAANYYLRLDSDAQHVDIYTNSTGTGTVSQKVLPSQLTALSTSGGAGSITIDNASGNVLSSSGVSLTGDGSTTLLIVGSGGGDTVTQNSGQILYRSIPINFSGITQTILNPNNGTDALMVNSGKMIVTAAPAGGGVLRRTFSTITIASGAQLQVLSPTSHADRALLVVSTLSIAGSIGNWTGTLDLGSNDMDLPGGNLSTITDLVAAGANLSGTSMSIKGLTSSEASSDTTHLTTLSVIQNNQGGSPIFGSGTGQSLFDNATPGTADILVKYTYFGDVNLDGKVDGSDYSRIDNGFINGLTGWFNGNFNYDSLVNGTDYTLIDNAFNSQGASLAAKIFFPSAIDKFQPVPFASTTFNNNSAVVFPDLTDSNIALTIREQDLLDDLGMIH